MRVQALDQTRPDTKRGQEPEAMSFSHVHTLLEAETQMRFEKRTNNGTPIPRPSLKLN